MKSTNKQVGRSTQSWINRVDRRRQIDLGYSSELRDWLQHVIMEAEETKDLKKRAHFQSLLNDLNTT